MLPAAPHLAGGLRVVATPADGGGFAAGVPAATAVSDTVPAAALVVRQVPLAAAPPVLAATAEGGGGGGGSSSYSPRPGGRTSRRIVEVPMPQDWQRAGFRHIARKCLHEYGDSSLRWCRSEMK